MKTPGARRTFAGMFAGWTRRTVVASLAITASLFLTSASSAQKAKPHVAAKAPSHAPGGTSHPGSGSTAGRPGNTGRPGNGGRVGTTGRPGGERAGERPGEGGAVRGREGGTTMRTARGGEISRNREGRMTSYHGANGREARFGPHGHVREVRGHGMVVSRGPRGMRRTMVERPDHSRLVAYGHGRGYISRPYSYGGHSYYSRAYYRHGGYYRSYYHPYYYHGVYLHGYIPTYYYPAAYYGWAYNPWPAPVPYAWGWAGNPWYGAYGAYFAPYPVYPSAAYWLTDYMVAATLADAYAAAAAADNAADNAAELRPVGAPHLVFASYDPTTGVTSPTMTKEVKDAVSEEIQRELAANQHATDPADGSTSSLGTVLADGQPHVFVANAPLTVTSGDDDCALTEGDVLGLSTAPAQDATTADMRVLASKQADCPKDSVVPVDLNDLQEMQNHLLSNIDTGMAQMKDHPGQGGLPAPPAAAIDGTREAPYAAAAPPADPNGAAELDQEAQQGAQMEQQVVAEASEPDGGGDAGEPAATGAAGPSGPVHSGPITITLGQTPEEVIAAKGQPTNKVNFPTKTIFIYPDMKIIFVKGKVSDVE